MVSLSTMPSITWSACLGLFLQIPVKHECWTSNLPFASAGEKTGGACEKGCHIVFRKVNENILRVSIRADVNSQGRNMPYREVKTR